MSDEPTTLTDPVLRLAKYWLSARLMHDHAQELREFHPDGLEGLVADGLYSDFQIYLQFWLSALYVVAEGFLELGLSDPKLCRLVKRHIDALRLYRNATFHFQKKPDKHVQFHDGRAIRLNWALDMHFAFEKFFRKHIRALERAAKARRPTISPAQRDLSGDKQ
jgi:hypothetical protein